jgi:hypothetical protein
MKPAGLFLYLSAGLVAVLAAEDTSAGLASRETKARIREGLPSYQPPPPKADGTPGSEDTTPRDPDLLVLPKMRVVEKRLPPDAADHLMSKRDFKRKMENLYLDEIAKQGPLNYLLNSFTIPILSPSKADRGRALYVRREMERLERVVEVSKALDPAGEKKFKEERDNTWTTRPAGELHGKSDLHGGSLP